MLTIWALHYLLNFETPKAVENKFLLADCMSPEIGLPSYPYKFFDLAIVDPPYGSDNITGGYTSGKGGGVTSQKNYHKALWSQSLPNAEYFKELIRVSKNQIIWGANHFISKIPLDSSCWIFWDKQNGDVSFADGELAWTSFDSAVRKVLFRWSGMLQADMSIKEHRQHPTQKPVALYRWILENYAKPGDLILDTHVGSASSLIACEQMGFNYVGFELDPDYYADAVKRMKKGIQTNLFAHGTNAPQNQIEQPKLFE